jgi:hypothetical protein
MSVITETTEEGSASAAGPLSITVTKGNDEFRHVVSLVSTVLNSFAAILEVPPVSVEMVLADDFVQEVERCWQRAEQDLVGTFDPERLGGIVAAKSIYLRADVSHVCIVFDGAKWPDEPTIADQLFWTWLISHELAHPCLGRLRYVSGALDGVPFPSVTPREVARSLTRGAIEEFRCDLVGEMVLKHALRITLDGKEQNLGIYDVWGGGYNSQFGEVISEHVYPGWPDKVEEYRNWRISLDELWQHIGRQTDQVMTLLGHAEAESISGEVEPPLVGPLAEHRGVQLYLGPAWRAIIEEARNAGFPNLHEFREAERRLCDIGEQAILGMWAKLGLTAEELENRDFRLNVAEPLR